MHIFSVKSNHVENTVPHQVPNVRIFHFNGFPFLQPLNQFCMATTFMLRLFDLTKLSSSGKIVYYYSECTIILGSEFLITKR